MRRGYTQPAYDHGFQHSQEPAYRPGWHHVSSAAEAFYELPQYSIFSASEVDLLRRANFQDSDLNGLALLRSAERTFAIDHARHLSRTGFSPQDILGAARQHRNVRRHLIEHADVYRDEGLSPNEILDRAHQATQATRQSDRGRLAIEDQDDVFVQAATRWGPAAGLSLEEGRSFYNEVTPEELKPRLENHRSLRLLLVGLAYVADYSHALLRSHHRERVKKMTFYLHTADNDELLRLCNLRAEEGVGQCGDAVNLAASQVECEILDHKLGTGLCNAREALDGVKRLFTQRWVETFAAGEYPNSKETVEFYASLSLEVTKRGFAMEDTARSNFYGEMFRVSPDQLNRCIGGLENHFSTPSDDYVEFLAENLAIQRLMPRLFPEKWSNLEHQQEELLDQLDNGECDSSMHMAVLNYASGLKNNWYRECVRRILQDNSLLDAELSS